MGNLRSVSKALEHAAGAHARVQVTSEPAVVADADSVVVPGQGAAADCMRSLAAVGMLDAVRQALREKPFLGICMGLQLLFEASDENDGTDCLGIFAGRVRAFPAAQRDARGERLKVPHMGWNQVARARAHPLLHDIEDHTRFYFVHSYYVDPDDATLIVARTEHGLTFTSAVAREQVFACQFHPEKSAASGLRLLRNFVRWDGRC